MDEIQNLRAYKSNLIRKTGINVVFYPCGWVLETDNYTRDKKVLEAILEIDKMIIELKNSYI